MRSRSSLKRRAFAALTEVANEVARLVPPATPVPDLEATSTAEAAFVANVINGVMRSTTIARFCAKTNGC